MISRASTPGAKAPPISVNASRYLVDYRRVVESTSDSLIRPQQVVMNNNHNDKVEYKKRLFTTFER